MVTFISHNPGQTEALGEKWGSTAESGCVIGLCGDLGAGKTQLVKGLARGLACSARVHSPSFSLVNVYEGGRLPLFHLDLYRLETREQIVNAGLEEYLHPSGVTVIEWADRWFGTREPQKEDCGRPMLARLPDSRNSQSAFGESRLFRWVTFETLGETERRICYEDPGA
jgi:tRNA threonylcarbamoyladenosine biosynthesis protein TsaE